MRSLYQWLQTVDDYRCGRKTKHDQTEMLTVIILGLLAGKMTLRAIINWAQINLSRLRKYLKLKGGIPSPPTLSRMLAGIDETQLMLAFISWMSDVTGTSDRHIAVDGKGLRGSALKVSGESTPYILNALDVGTCLVIGQYAIPAKTNEITAIPELLELLNIKGCTVTIDAIGTMPDIIAKILDVGAHFVLQVKKNQKSLYDNIQRFFDLLAEEREVMPERYDLKYAPSYSMHDYGILKNRDRYESRVAEGYTGAAVTRKFWDRVPELRSIGRLTQTRIKLCRDSNGNDITPSLSEFLKSGSIRQPKVKEGDEADDDIQRVGLISDRVLDAESLAVYKRDHWAVENSLHYILDMTYKEDRSTIRKGKVNAAVLRKIAYNTIRLVMHDSKDEKANFQDVFIKVAEDWESVSKYIFDTVSID